MKGTFEEKDTGLRTLALQKGTELASAETGHTAEEDRLRKVRGPRGR
jgi:hypothetical protein